MNVRGIITEKFETKEFGATSFKVREIVVKTAEQYPQHIKIQFTQDKIKLLDHYGIGSEVNVHINLRGKRSENSNGEVSYWNNIEGWRIEKGEAEQKATSTVIEDIEVNDGLPF